MTVAGGSRAAIVALTAGDVAGIGPEVIVKSLLSEYWQDDVPLLIGDPEIFSAASRLANLSQTFASIETNSLCRDKLFPTLNEARRSGKFLCLNPCGDEARSAPRSRVSHQAGRAAFLCLSTAIDLALATSIDAIVTAPLSKAALSVAGHHYPGHTEILAERCGVDEFAMMLYLPEIALAGWRSGVRLADESFAEQNGLSIAHVTLHTSIRSVADLLTTETISSTIRLVSGFLTQIGSGRKSVGVCALNPHGGENGLFGTEESSVIFPAVESCRKAGLNVTGPLPADTLVRRAIAGEFDGLVAMYHDQGHIPVKLVGFHSAVNITLGLPLVRTSPTHGTAFDRAWNPATPADPRGMQEAIRVARKLIRRPNNQV